MATRLKPRTELVHVTPRVAEDWLTRNTHNRPVKDAIVERYCGDMTAGYWRPGERGAPIKWDTDGKLQDGQHRLWAVMLSGKTIDFTVIYDLPPEDQDIIDTGVPRTLADVLSLRDESDSAQLAAIVRLKWRLDTGNIRFPGKKPSVSACIAVLEQNPGLREAIPVARRFKRFKVSKSVIAMCWYEFHRIDAELCQTMFDRLYDGVGLNAGSPIYVLRRWLERQSGGRASALMTHALFVKAWNALREGRHVTTLVWRTADEEFPTPR